jgi:flagellar hook-basal body protein
MGSPSGIWTSVSGGMAQSQSVDVIANNLANVNTTGFKKDTPTFKEYLTAIERPPSPESDIPRTAFKDSDFYHHDGKEHAFVNLNKVHTEHTQGNLRMTNGAFDVAIDGPGFFAVKTPAGIMFTRAGDFKVDGQGKLVTQDGYSVLALSGEAEATKTDGAAQQEQQPAQPGAETSVQAQPQAQNTPGVATRAPASINPFTQKSPNIAAANAPLPTPGNPAQPEQQALLKEISLVDVLSEGRKVHITTDGQVFAGTELIGVLAMAEFTDPALLQKTTSTLYTNPNSANVPKLADVSRVRQGFLETSNVNAVSELVNLLKANRMFESNMRAIKTYNEMAGKEANEVGKL